VHVRVVCFPFLSRNLIGLGMLLVCWFYLGQSGGRLLNREGGGCSSACKGAPRWRNQRGGAHTKDRRMSLGTLPVASDLQHVYPVLVSTAVRLGRPSATSAAVPVLFFLKRISTSRRSQTGFLVGEKLWRG
jgi:hypothetical protein